MFLITQVGEPFSMTFKAPTREKPTCIIRLLTCGQTDHQRQTTPLPHP